MPQAGAGSNRRGRQTWTGTMEPGDAPAHVRHRVAELDRQQHRLRDVKLAHLAHEVCHRVRPAHAAGDNDPILRETAGQLTHRSLSTAPPVVLARL